MSKEKVVAYFKKNKSTIQVILIIAAAYIFFAVVGVGCPIKYTTGISCMGCGMTRAIVAACKLNFKDAFYFHPLWVLLPVGFVVFLLRKRINPTVIKVLLWIAIIAFVIVYFIRMFDDHNHIVVFEPENNIIGRLYDTFK